MTDPKDRRWDDEGIPINGIFSLKTARLYVEAREDIDAALNKIQSSIDKVQVRAWPKLFSLERQP